MLKAHSASTLLCRYSPEEQRKSDPTPCVFTSITPAWYVPAWSAGR